MKYMRLLIHKLHLPIKIIQSIIYLPKRNKNEIANNYIKVIKSCYQNTLGYLIIEMQKR